MKNYAAIILAAGYSTRMGSFKPIINLAGKTPLQRCIELFKNCGINNIIVVTGYLNDRIEKELCDIKIGLNDIKVVINDKYSEGMYSSIIAGVESLTKETDAFFILPVDIPSVRDHTVKKMMESYDKIKGGIMFPIFEKETGHPTLVPYSLTQEIIRSNPKGGLRELFNQHKKQWYYEPVADRGVLLDMDTKEDFKVLLEHLSVYPCPDYKECMEILRLCNVKLETINHMKSVAEFAKGVSLLLNDNGYKLNINYIYAGALLHDVAKGSKNHALQGAKIVEGFGYKCPMEIINQHMSLKTKYKIGEKEIVYLCDKLFKGETLVTLKERFEDSFSRYKDVPDVFEKVNEKYINTKILKEKVESILGIKLENISDKF
ncbi:HD domain-containing protein [Clostridium estertheticum]|uniref:HD domain-containing protein n=1 Tax=Clostridium estertheticum TaxID=238834 RepID=A0A5N7IKU6_9CLOT|nr:NTP transferase domain-containing protein [Clostridium estertheticum]MPQ30924.1 HD domain-containing protein [Clostridium estertheticum]MPQ61600.1 HD domain-containing protein [Clostridium estertheticum]